MSAHQRMFMPSTAPVTLGLWKNTRCPKLSISSIGQHYKVGYCKLTHSAGLSYGFETGHPVDRLYQRAEMFQDEPLAEKVRRLCQLPLVGQPGTHYWYSLAHDVLGHLIEVISGRPLDVFFQERIFGPLGMVDTGFWVRREDLDRLVTMYAPHTGGGLQQAEGPEVDRTARPPRSRGAAACCRRRLTT